jgi:hypothetical protein
LQAGAQEVTSLLACQVSTQSVPFTSAWVFSRHPSHHSTIFLSSNSTTCKPHPHPISLYHRIINIYTTCSPHLSTSSIHHADLRKDP